MSLLLKISRRQFLLKFFSGILFAVAAGSANAADYPSRPIQIIVANGIGSTADLVGRILAPKISDAIGAPVVLDNKPGGDQIVGVDYVVSRAAADGYTVGLVTVDGLLPLPLLHKDVPFDVIKAVVPVIASTEGYLAVVSPATAPWKTFKEFVENAKANPGKLNFGASTPTARSSVRVW